jgi:hypothetical protein
MISNRQPRSKHRLRTCNMKSKRRLAKEPFKSKIRATAADLRYSDGSLSDDMNSMSATASTRETIIPKSIIRSGLMIVFDLNWPMSHELLGLLPRLTPLDRSAPLPLGWSGSGSGGGGGGGSRDASES